MRASDGNLACVLYNTVSRISSHIQDYGHQGFRSQPSGVPTHLFLALARAGCDAWLQAEHSRKHVVGLVHVARDVCVLVEAEDLGARHDGVAADVLQVILEGGALGGDVGARG